MSSSLDAYLRSALDADEGQRQIAEAIRHLCTASIKVRNTIIEGGSGNDLGGQRGDSNSDGDIQKELDVIADKAFLQAARDSSFAFFGSEEQDEAVTLSKDGLHAIAIDPLDGSSNISTNVSIGTIFSILPVTDAHRKNPKSVFEQKGANQLAAGFFTYGPQLQLVLTVGNGTHVFLFSPKFGGFVEQAASVMVADRSREFSANMSNYRHWDVHIRNYIDDCLAGAEGPRERDFGMRYVGSLVADAYRILQRGGVFLYPGDERKGYQKGRLRLMYEANPVAMLMEQAGGAATDGARRILDIEPESLHVRTPLVFGSKREVERIGRYMTDSDALAERSPLFGKRTLFRP
ncbi:class 1 fructose-bisphosphatase [Fulvimarina sp. 2208YS6-2-32]|uniref:Fructose-1,6-bisphosphatase class 1 n=1 Tax=Fulvimarina uroteuthidis TaxID=3098149 RepID=A0ABU5HZF0_9HYPH|nr:class 1 fructose-bisphosphatase [Fulvimarina sp. 2208YS6-2-32]MDY8107933.1 class 1 fructose-bisphosphatase [Fulvimarina sp. 2208YS6-2-32]